MQGSYYGLLVNIMTSQIKRIKDHFKAIGFAPREISARVIKNKWGENIDTYITLDSKQGQALRDRVYRTAPQLAKLGYDLNFTFYNGNILHVSITEANYGKRGNIDYGQTILMINKLAKEMGL